MSNLVSNVQIILENSGYRAWLGAMPGSSFIAFEDESAMGFVFIFGTATELLERWRDKELEILMRHAPNFHHGGDKVWNIYSIFLCEERPNETQMREIRQIEENLEKTRKIATGGAFTIEELTQTLLPLLAIQYAPRLDDEDLSARLRKRFSSIAPLAADAIFGSSDAAEIVQLLGNKQ